MPLAVGSVQYHTGHVVQWVIGKQFYAACTLQRALGILATMGNAAAVTKHSRRPHSDFFTILSLYCGQKSKVSANYTMLPFPLQQYIGLRQTWH